MKSYESLFYEALLSEFGLVLRTNDVDRCIAKLYRDRGDNPALKAITIKRSPTKADEIWLIKEVPNEAPS